MQNQGFSINNLHIGDSRIKGQGQTLIIGNENGGDGYILPDTKGSEGQVLTANADNTTSFQDANGITGRVYKNLYTMIDPQTFYPNDQTPVPIYASGYGDLDLDINEFPVGATIRLYTEGKFNLFSASGAFSFFINDLTYRKDVVVPAALVGSSQSFYHFHLSVQRLNTNEYRFQGSGVVCTTSGGSPVVTMDWGAETIVPPSPLTFFNIKLTWLTINSLYYPITRTFFVDMILDSSLLIEAPPAPTSHLALTDLTASDAGHTQFALLQGRSGGQVLSGGLTSANFLTLKSHTAGLNNIVVKDLNTTFEKNIDMDGNSVSNIQEINGQGGLQYMRIANTGLFQIDGGEITQTSDTNINIYPTTNLRLGAGGSNIVINPATELDLQGGLNMNNNNIVNVPQVSNSAGNLLLTSGIVGLDGTLAASIRETTTNMFVSVANNAVTIAKSNDPSPPSGIATFTTSAISTDLGVNFEINGTVIYVRPNSMPNFFVGDTTYIFVGNRSTSNSYTLPDNCKIRGLGKNNSRIDFNGGGTLFSSVDANISVSDITLTSSNTTGKLFDLSNVAKDKTIDMTGLQIRNTYNGMLIDGYDLVDMLNCVFTYFQSGSPTPVGVKMSNNSKVQFTSCEFLRWFQEGGVPSTTAFVGNMLEFNTSVNAYNITSSFFHPQYDQNGIDLSNVTSTIEGTISANTFIDINLNTGGGFLVLNIPPVVATNAIVESNSIYPNLKSQVTYVLSAVNTLATDLSVSNPNVINHNNLALPLAIQFATIGTNGLITYTKKRTSNFMIVATCNLELVAGTNNRIGLGLFVNGIAVPLAYSYVNLSASGTANQKSATLSFTGTANQNDTFQLSVFNATANNNVIVSDINFAGIEI